MQQYFYDGPVYVFDTMVCDNFHAVTVAMSRAQAANNFKYQAKRMLGLTVGGTKVILPNEVLTHDEKTYM